MVIYLHESKLPLNLHVCEFLSPFNSCIKISNFIGEWVLSHPNKMMQCDGTENNFKKANHTLHMHMLTSCHNCLFQVMISNKTNSCAMQI